MRRFFWPDEGESLPLALMGRAVDALLIIAGALIIILMFGNVTSRFIFNFDVAWSTELINFLMIWATFLGGAAATRRRAQMRIAEFVGLLGGRSRRLAEIAINCAVAYLLFLLAWYGWVIAAGNMDQLSSVLYYPMGVQYAALPAGSAIALVYVLRDILLLGSGELLNDDIEI